MSDLRVVREYREALLHSERRRRRSARPLLAAAAALVVGAGIATAATGSFPVGDPIPSPWSDNDRRRVPEMAPAEGSGRLARVRAPDPDGGPPWGLRVFRTQRGLTCDQAGRIVRGRLGVIGDNGVFREAPLAAYGCGSPSAPPPANAGIREYGGLGGGAGMTASGAGPGEYSRHPCTRFVGARQSFERRTVICDEHRWRWVHAGVTGPRVVAVELRAPGLRERWAVVDQRYLIVRRGEQPSGVIAYAVFRNGRRRREWSTPHDRVGPVRRDAALARRVAPRASPTVVRPEGQVIVKLRAPRREPKYGDWYTVGLRGPDGCRRQGNVEFTLSTSKRLRTGDATRFALRPPGPSLDAGRAWCPGRYTGTLAFRGRLTAGTFVFEVRR